MIIGILKNKGEFMSRELKIGQFYKCRKGFVVRITKLFCWEMTNEEYIINAVTFEEVATGNEHGLLISEFNEDGRFELFVDEYPKYPKNDDEEEK